MTVTANLACLDNASNAKGQKTAAVIRDGQPAFWTLPSPVTPLFAPSAYKGVSGDSSGRLSLCSNAGPDVMAEAEEIDRFAISYCTLHSDRLFGKALTESQVADRCNSIVKKNDKYPPFRRIGVHPRIGMRISRVALPRKTGRLVRCFAGPGSSDSGLWATPLGSPIP